jgi:hypothetical protein
MSGMAGLLCWILAQGPPPQRYGGPAEAMAKAGLRNETGKKIPSFCAQDEALRDAQRLVDLMYDAGEKVREVESESARLADPHRTPKCLSARAGRGNPPPDYKTMDPSFALKSRTEEKDGSVVYDCWRRVEIETTERRDLQRFVFVREEGRWVLRDYRIACFGCDAGGGCARCVVEGRSPDCPECKGSGVCPACRGEKMRPHDLAAFVARRVDAPADARYSEDWSTPARAVESYADLRVKAAVVAARRQAEILAPIHELLRRCGSRAMVERLAAALAAEEESGPKRFAQWRPSFGPIVDKEGVARVEANIPYDGFSRPRRLTLKKSGDRWLIDAERDPCGECSGSGSCVRCAGSSAGECGHCAGEKLCPSCGGTRWEE